MSDLLLDPQRSHVRIHTFAEGLLARLAHDLELACGELSGTASRAGSGASGEASGTARLEVPLRAISVSGRVAKDGSVDDRAMTPAERRDCLAKMHQDVFHATGAEAVVRVETHFERGEARVRIIPPSGKAVEALVRPVLHVEGEAVRATGTLEVSLRAMGSDVVKGPMGAFRVKDRVEVLFDVLFVPRP